MYWKSLPTPLKSKQFAPENKSSQKERLVFHYFVLGELLNFGGVKGDFMATLFQGEMARSSVAIP